MKWILTVLLAVALLGCGADSTSVEDSSDIWSAKYPGAPTISIHQTSVDWDANIRGIPAEPGARINYRLEAQDSLPYNIEVNLTIELIGMTEADDNKEFDFSEKMQVGRMILGESRWTGGKYKAITVWIMPWGGLGDAPYNVGSPRIIRVKR